MILLPLRGGLYLTVITAGELSNRRRTFRASSSGRMSFPGLISIDNAWIGSWTACKNLTRKRPGLVTRRTTIRWTVYPSYSTVGPLVSQNSSSSVFFISLFSFWDGVCRNGCSPELAPLRAIPRLPGPWGGASVPAPLSRFPGSSSSALCHFSSSRRFGAPTCLVLLAFSPRLSKVASVRQTMKVDFPCLSCRMGYLLSPS